MRQKNRRKERLLTVLICLFLFIAVPVFGGGRKDADLVRADKLIEDKLYDEAISLLSDYVKRNPDNFDHAQRRFQKIIRLRGDYNTIADRLLDAIEETPENVELIYELTTQLEGMASPQNSATQDFIRRTRILAEFALNRRRLGRILVEGRSLLDKGDYTGAIRAYAGGFDIYRDEFFRSGYGELVENQVNGGIRDVDFAVGELSEISGRIRSAAGSLEQLIGARNLPDPAELRGVYNQLKPHLDELAELKNRLISVERYFTGQLALLQQQDPGLGERSFLSFAGWLLRGRSADSVQEGMIGAVAGLWIDGTSRYEDTLAAVTERAYRTAYTSAYNKDYRTAVAQLDVIGQYIGLPGESFKTWSQFREQEKPVIREIFDQPVVEEKAADYFKYESMRRAVAYIKQAELLGERFLDISESENIILNTGTRASAAGAMQNELAAQRAYEELLGRVDVLSNEVDQGESALRTYQYNVVRTSVIPPYMRDAQTIVDELNADITYQVNNASVRRYIIANRQLERHLFQGESRLEEGNALLEGHEREIQGVKFAAKYPVEAAAILTQMEQDLEAGLELGAVLLAQYKKEDPQILASPEMQDLYGAAQTTVNRLEVLQGQGHAQGETARNLAAQAEALRIDGDRLYREAEAALVQSNFDAARDRLTRTGERYDASLVIEDDDNLRAIRDDRLLRLGAEITRLENERIIREVRELVNGAKTTYYAGNFEQSEEMLVRAQNRWRVTNTEPNPEVVYWLTLVRGALSIRSGRIIPPTAPLYPEMSQLLSEAKKNYDEGIRFFNVNRRTDGLAKFNAAREKTREVKLMFPINEEAGLLDLRMDQIADPAAFNASFRQRLNAAVSGTKQRSTQAYADLQNLAVINPRYPGMRNILDQAEIDMGIRPPPPDPRDLAQSAELTKQALAIINANVRVQFEIAKAQLGEAIGLDPNNSAASEALDRVNNLIGGSDTIVLTNNAEAEYQRAVRELQQGNTIVAMSIVQQLLQDPRNRTSRILDLQRRIESML
ncbi:MAG: hypothetical protein LBO80_10885 [Treponema sp.]|jgi:hypothetical protein|nr:hypothetical protein [Treponema sp.]